MLQKILQWSFIVAFGSLRIDALNVGNGLNRLPVAVRGNSVNRGTITMRKGRPSTRIVPKKSPSSDTASNINWVQIAAAESELPEEGKSQAITLPGGKVLMVLKAGDSFRLLGASCKKCKFPLLNAELDRDEGSIACSVCGTKYSFENGATGMFPKVPKSGPAALFSDIMSSSGGGPIEAYEVKTAPTGKVYAAMPKL